MKLRKFWPLVGAMCLGLVSSAFAHSNYQNTGSSSDPSYGSSMDSSSQTGQGTYQRGTFREITPNAGPRVAHGADVFITADFIWWKAVQDGLRYGTSGIDIRATAADPFSPAARRKVENVGEDWAPGFKVGLGLNMAHDGWDLYAEYTWLHASDISSHTPPLPGVFIASFSGVGEQGGQPVIITALSGSANWHLHFNVINLELGRNFYLSQFLTMRPHIGIKGTWQDQTARFSYLTGETNELFEINLDDGTEIATVGPYRMRGKTDVWGHGVRGGLDVSWYMSKSWSIFGKLAWTTMWADYHTLSRVDTLEVPERNNSKVIVNIDNSSYYTVKYVGELELGLRWETWFYDDNYHFSIQAGWEEQVWINWVIFTVVEEQQNEHDLSLHGLNLKFRFDF